MSNVLAIAGVTRILKDMLNDALVFGNVEQVLGTDFIVTAQPPDRIVSDTPDTQTPHLNLFLHRVTPNAALRNADLPTRTGDGHLRMRPTLALDLHYILTSVAREELHAEVLLGYAMQLFHEMQIVPRETIRTSLSAADLTGLGGGLPDFGTRPLSPAELADQIELLKITPVTLSMDDMSKMWTALQASYRTTVAYDVSVVLIERALPVRPTLPVLTRGGLRDPETGRDPGVSVEPSLASNIPSLLSVESEDAHPVMRLGGRVILTGTGLDSGDAQALFREAGNDTELRLVPEAPARPDRLLVQLPGPTALPGGSALAGTPQDPASWRSGAYEISVTVTDNAQRTAVTNRLPLALAPAISATAVAGVGGTEVTVDVSPPIRIGQEIAILAGTEMRVLPNAVAVTDQVDATFDGPGVGADLVVRLRVDGVDSPAIDRSATPPVLQTVTVT
ncbi:DUF4255 domain-containing protein [Ruegeria arenilitoris]|uniref:DUF4255 domain-containing protein n=1 Tax=Ruegeria arenilitoris TaxID=1173585 RepID=UPI00147BB3E4|nr:DUF4255 domain-containing protein [Ruegeria arenilitoris]